MSLITLTWYCIFVVFRTADFEVYFILNLFQLYITDDRIFISSCWLSELNSFFAMFSLPGSTTFYCHCGWWCFLNSLCETHSYQYGLQWYYCFITNITIHIFNVRKYLVLFSCRVFSNFLKLILDLKKDLYWAKTIVVNVSKLYLIGHFWQVQYIRRAVMYFPFFIFSLLRDLDGYTTQCSKKNILYQWTALKKFTS